MSAAPEKPNRPSQKAKPVRENIYSCRVHPGGTKKRVLSTTRRCSHRPAVPQVPHVKAALGSTPSGATPGPNAMSYKPWKLWRVRALNKPRTLYGSGQLTRKAPCFNMGRGDGKNRQVVYLYTPAPHTTKPTSRGQKFPCLKRRNTPNVSSATNKKTTSNILSCNGCKANFHAL